MKNLSIFVPLTKVDHSQHLVTGVLAEEAPDKSGEVFDWETGKAAVLAWSETFKKATEGTGQEPSLGNLRVMHTGKAVGKFVSVVPNVATKQIEVAAKVVDEEEWKKVAAGIYTGFSLGGSYTKKWADPKQPGLTRYTPAVAEGSLADNPCMWGSTFTAIKADGAEELVKMVGLQKDAGGATAAAQAAIDSIKQVLVELGTLTGDVQSITLSDLATALDALLFVKADAAAAQADEASTAPETPAAPTEQEMAAALETGDMSKLEPVVEMCKTIKQLMGLGLLKQEEKKKEDDEEEEPAPAKEDDDEEAPKELTDEQKEELESCVIAQKEEGKTQDEAFAICTAQVTKTMEPKAVAATAADMSKTARLAWGGPEPLVQDLTEPMTKLLTESETVKTALVKTVTDAVTKAVETGLTGVITRLTDMDSRLEQVESTPAAVGRTVAAVRKSLGSEATGEPSTVNVDDLGKAVDTLEAKGVLRGKALQDARMGLAAASVPKV